MVYTVSGVNYTRRKKIPVTGAASGAQTDFQIKLAATWAAAMQADFDDVRFTKADMQTLIDAWLEDKVDSTSANVWVEFPTTPADGVEKTKAYMYFGNAGASSDWDIGATFLLGDDFEHDTGSKFDNAASAQTTPTYDTSGQAIHPSIVYFSTAWNGYKYWMAMTPYPGGDESKENPSILASTDGSSWEVPSGLTNPIEPEPGTGHYSDTELVYNDDTDELWCYYRWNLSPDAKMYLQKSSNGTSWDTKQSVLEDTTSNGILSPAIVKQGSNWYLWFIKSISSHYEVEYYTSSNGTSWTYNSTLDLDIDVGGNKEPWHLEVRYISEKSEYWMLYNISGGGYDLAFAKSSNRTTWTKYNKFVLSPSASGWDDGFIYRSTFRYNSSNDKIEVWYTGKSSGGVWHTGYTDKDYDDLQTYLTSTNVPDTNTWTVEKKGSTSAIVELDGEGNLHLAGEANVVSSGNIKSIATFTNGIRIRCKRFAAEQEYRDISLGYGSLVGRNGSTSWWHTTFYDGYTFGISNDAAGRIVEMNSGVYTYLSSSGLDIPNHGSWRIYDLFYKSDGTLDFTVDDVSYDTKVDTTHLNNNKNLLISQGEYSGGQGGLSDIDYIFVSKYVSGPPTYEFGGEEHQRRTPQFM